MAEVGTSGVRWIACSRGIGGMPKIGLIGPGEDWPEEQEVEGDGAVSRTGRDVLKKHEVMLEGTRARIWAAKDSLADGGICGHEPRSIISNGQ